MRLCEAFIRGRCVSHDCPHKHSPLPYVWQVDMSNVAEIGQVVPLSTEEAVAVEKAFCNPATTSCSLQMSLTSPTLQSIVTLTINFSTMQAVLLTSSGPPTLPPLPLPVCRLSTPSYTEGRASPQSQQQVGEDGEGAWYLTQWRWYYLDSKPPETWKLFGESTDKPRQCVLESKYVHGRQKLYLFDQTDLGDMTVELKGEGGVMVALGRGMQWKVVRRPLFIGAEDLQLMRYHLSPPTSETEFSQYLPTQWTPVDPQQEAELVPLHPECMDYHLVASEFHKTLPTASRRISDIFRVQNPYLWHKYASKKLHMERKMRGAEGAGPKNDLEIMLFHGTGREEAVRAIVRENFDWRIAGSANAALYGQGAYFAVHANYSDKYALVSNQPTVRNWMFFARVLVGKSTLGVKGLLRPPALDPARPHLGLYDSCVDRTVNPKLYVIFDCDQCYPEYIVSYSKR